MWNLLNYAAVTVPVGAVDASVDGPDESWKRHVPRNASDEFNHRQCECSFLFLLSFFLGVFVFRGKELISGDGGGVDDVDLVKDMPICLQIVGGRFGEEKAVAVAKVVDEVMKGGQ